MRFRPLFLICVLLLGAQPVSVQSIEERVARLELQVAELWQFHDRAETVATDWPISR